MAIYPQEQDYEVLGTWGLPKRGVIRLLPAHELPVDALWEASNVVIRDGMLQARKGLTQLSSTTLGARPVGASMYQEEDGSRIPLVVTRNRIWKYESGAWTDITSGLLTGTADNLGRITLLEFGSPGTVYAIVTNGKDTMQQWDGDAATVSTVSGSPPLFTDICTVADRIVGIVPPYEIGWGEALTLSIWPTLNKRFAAESVDRCVAIRSQGPLGFILFKESSLWSGSFVGGASSQAFVLQWRKDVEGPAGPNAVVKAGSVWLYMTPTGRIGAWDGFSHVWVADGLLPILNPETGDATAKVDATNMGRAVGSYDGTHQEVTFWYPRTGDSGECKGLVTVMLPKPEWGLPFWAAFLGVTATAISAAMEMRLSDNLDKVLAFSSTASDNRSFTLVAGNGDDGAAFSGSWQTGLVSVPGLGQHRVSHLEGYFDRAAGYGTVTFKMVSSSALDTPGGDIEATGKSIDLTQVLKRSEYGRDVRGRFLGLQFSFTTASKPKWMGGRLLGLPREKR